MITFVEIRKLRRIERKRECSVEIDITAYSSSKATSGHLTGRENWQYPLWTVLMMQAWLARQRQA